MITESAAPSTPKKHGRRMSKRMRAHLSKVAKARWAAKREAAKLSLRPASKPTSTEFERGFIEGIVFARTALGS